MENTLGWPITPKETYAKIKFVRNGQGMASYTVLLLKEELKKQIGAWDAVLEGHPGIIAANMVAIRVSGSLRIYLRCGNEAAKPTVLVDLGRGCENDIRNFRIALLELLVKTSDL